MSPDSSTSSQIEMASVLFMDLIGFSRNPIETQRDQLHRLQEIVRESTEYRLAESSAQFIKIPTGDGMALCFTHNPVSPVRCAVQIQSALRHHPDLPLRIGIHTGPVFRHSDIKDNTNIVGSGINIAQRVMDCCDAGHILVSRPVAEVLAQTSEWAPYLHDLGEVTVKHGLELRLFNLVCGDAGNPAVPSKFAPAGKNAGPSRQDTGAGVWWGRRGLLLLPVAATTLLLLWLTPLRKTLFPAYATLNSGGTAHRDYIKAQNLLDHFYQPNTMDSAISLFSRTVAEDPRFALAYAGLCRAYFWQFRDSDNPALIEKAQNACTQALALDRDLASAHVTLGMLYTQTSRSDLAGQELKEALSLDSKNAEVWAALAELYNRQGRSNDVVPTLQKAVDLAPTDWRWPNQIGTYYLGTGNLEEASRYYQQAVSLTRDNARVWNNLGIAFRRRSRFSEAEQAFGKAIGFDPKDIYYTNLGNVLEQERKYPEAAEVLEKAVKLNPSSYLAYANLASVLDQIPGAKEKARESYLKAISLGEDLRRSNPGDATLLASLGSYYATLAMSAKSLPLLRQAGALAPDDPQVLFRVAEGYELLHLRDDALRWIGRALEHEYSVEALKRNPEMAGLIADPRFATISTRAR